VGLIYRIPSRKKTAPLKSGGEGEVNVGGRVERGVLLRSDKESRSSDARKEMVNIARGQIGIFLILLIKRKRGDWTDLSEKKT